MSLARGAAPLALAMGMVLMGAGMVFAHPGHPGHPPADEAGAIAQINASPRHGEWVTVDAAGGDKVDLWVVYPERADKAPVVIVVHEIFGLSDWARAVADQVAAEGFIAVAPDFLTGKGPGGGGSRTMTADQARGLFGGLQAAEITNRLNAAARYGTSLPAANKEFGVIGFCWGGGISFSYATQQPDLDAAVAFYGTSPATDALARVQAPVLGLYGGADARVNATIPGAEAEMKRLGKRYEYEIFDGAGHGFLRQQAGQAGANLAATEKAWTRMVAFLKQSLAPKMALDLGVAIPVWASEPECTCHDAEPVSAVAAR
jgi:carboxymethylenebutenolidase